MTDFMTQNQEQCFFHPTQTDDLVDRALPFVNQWVTVDGWHENIAMRDKYPDEDIVGYVVEFQGDIPKSELPLWEPNGISVL